MEDLETRYFNWLVSKVQFPRYSKYLKLFSHLHKRIFSYNKIPMDGNRSEDGIDLRYRGFGYEENIDQHEIERYLDRRDCSMLEMMVALAIRAENIVGNSVCGDRTGLWFLYMIVSLGVKEMDDDHYDKETVDFAIDNFLEHNYEPNGKGGLFTVENPPHDMRDVEIWSQMCWFLNENA